MVGIDNDAAIHLLVIDLHPTPFEPDLRVLVRRRVKALRKGTVHVGWNKAAVLLVQRHRPMAADGGQKLL